MSTTLRHILITGGCGFIGVNLVAALRASHDALIRVLDNERLGKREYLAQWDVEFLRGDLRDAETVERAVAGVDCVVHLAADTRVMDSIVDPDNNFAVNVMGTMNLLRAMRKAGVERIVSASTGGAILGEVPPPAREDMPPSPASPYGAGKLAVEGYLSAFAGSYGMRACSLRFSNVYGPHSFHKGSVVAAFFRAILATRPITVFGDGSQTRDYVFVKDLCRGILSAMEKGATGVYQLGSGIPTTINQLIKHIRAIVEPRHQMHVRYEEFRAGELRRTWCDIDKARRVLGYEPRTCLQDGLLETWDWFTLQTQC